MKKLLLLPLIAIGLALVPAKQADAQVSVGIGGVGVGFGYPAHGYNYGYPGYGYYPRSYYGYYGGLHITDRITPDGRTTTAAIELTSIIGITITATKAGDSCEGWLAWSNSKPAFFSKHELSCSFLAALAEKILQDCSAFFLQNTGCDLAVVIK